MKIHAYVMIALVLFANSADAQPDEELRAREDGVATADAVASTEQTEDPEDSVAVDDAAAINDDFEVETTDSRHCGSADFDDYGPGAPGGGNNDDYIVIHDNCADGHGVRAQAWVGRDYVGSQYNGNGLEGAPVIWDPFRVYHPDGNVLPGQSVVIEVCLVDGPNDSSGSSCRQVGSVIQDG